MLKMTMIEFKKKVNIKEIEKIVEKYNCKICITSSIDTDNGSIAVLGTTSDAEKLRDALVDFGAK